jgi:23S rRNA pseudouridine1911/1915/1917 synthase
LPKTAKYIDAPDPDLPPVPPAPEDEDGDEPAAAPAQRLRIGAAQSGLRLDRALAELLPAISRSRLQHWIAAGAVRPVSPMAPPPRARDAVAAGEEFDLTPIAAADVAAYLPQPMALSIVHEDEALLVLDKPAGLVVHPAAGHWQGTLLNGLLAHDPALVQVPRAGIVHRLDAGTSGLMAVARTLAAQADLVRQLQQRSVLREYWAVVHGEAPATGTIEAAIGRDRRNPLRFVVSRSPGARPARTHFRRIATVACDGRAFSWLACRLDTGRTHQIRVHLEHLGHPLVGDPLYRRGRPSPAGDALTSSWAGYSRQALHACRLGLLHPASGVPMQWFRAPPEELRALIKALGFGRSDRPRAAFE